MKNPADDLPAPEAPLPPELAALSGQQLANTLLERAAKLLLQRVVNGTASSADLAVVRAMARDQNAQLSPVPGGTGAAIAAAARGALTDKLPFAGSPSEPLQ